MRGRPSKSLDAEVKGDQTANRHGDAEQEPEDEGKRRVTKRDEPGEHGSPEVKQHVQKERVIDAAAAVADIS